MENTSHFIITRFNLPLYERDKKRQPTRTDEWLAHRFDIFEKYCLPSIRAQTCNSFVWLCLLDEATPVGYKTRMAEYASQCPVLRPVFYDAAQTADLPSSLRRTMAEFVRPDTKWVLTTNLDNDDALNIRAVERLQSEISNSEIPKVYVFLYGYQYFTEMNFALKLRLPNNHFLSLLEPWGEAVETIAAFRHARVSKLLNTTYIDTEKGMWLEVIHASNVSNDLRIYGKARNIPVFAGRSFADFGLNIKVGAIPQAFRNIFVMPFKFIATGIHRLRTKKERRKDNASVRCETSDIL